MAINQDSILMDHNIDTYKNAVEMLNKHGRVAVVQPTGTGKSFIAMRLMYDYTDCKKIVLAPSREFLNTLEKSEFWDKKNTITFTYQYLVQYRNNMDDLINRITSNGSRVGIIIIDEMHRVGAKYWQQAVVSLVNKCSEAHVVGLTATPIRYRDNRDMVAELFNGVSVGNTSIADAILSGILPKMHYVVGIGDVSREVNRILIKYDKHKAILGNKLTEVKALRNKWNVENSYKHTLHKYITDGIGGSKHIVFMPSIVELEKRKDRIKEIFEEVFNGYKIELMCTHSKLSKSENNEALLRFSGNAPSDTIMVMIAVQMINESFHFNGIKSIAMFRHTEAVNVFIQQIGRGLTAKGEIPYIFDFVDNFDCVGDIALLAGNCDSDYSDMGIVFDEFIDETVDCIDELEQVRRKLDARITMFNRSLYTYANKYGALQNIPDIRLRDWAVNQYITLKCQNSSIIERHKAEFEFTDFIAIAADSKWWYKLNNYTKLDEESKAGVIDEAVKLWLCGLMGDRVLVYVNSHTNTDIRKYITDEYLYNIIKDSERRECRAVVRIIDFIKQGDKFRVFDSASSVEHLINLALKPCCDGSRTFGLSEVDKVAAIRLFDRVKNNPKFSSMFNIEHTEDESLLYRTVKIKKRKVDYINLSIEGFARLNAGILRIPYDNQSEFIKNTMKILAVKDMESLFNIIDNACGMSVSIDYIRTRCNAAIDGGGYSTVNKEAIEEATDKFIRTFGSVDKCEYFSVIYDDFIENVLPLVRMVTGNSKYGCMENAIKVVNEVKVHNRYKVELNNIMGSTKAYRAKVKSSFKGLYKRYKMSGNEENAEQIAISRLIDEIRNSYNRIIIDGDIERYKIIYRIYNLDCKGVPGYEYIRDIVKDEEFMYILDRSLFRVRLREKLICTANFMDTGFDFMRSAHEAGLYSDFKATDVESIDMIKNARLVRNKAFYDVIRNIYSLPSSCKARNRMKELA